MSTSQNQSPFKMNSRASTVKQNQQIATLFALITLAIIIEMARAAPIREEHLHARLGCGTSGDTTCGTSCMLFMLSSLIEGIVM